MNTRVKMGGLSVTHWTSGRRQLPRLRGMIGTRVIIQRIDANRRDGD